ETGTAPHHPRASTRFNAISPFTTAAFQTVFGDLFLSVRAHCYEEGHDRGASRSGIEPTGPTGYQETPRVAALGVSRFPPFPHGLRRPFPCPRALRSERERSGSEGNLQGSSRPPKLSRQNSQSLRLPPLSELPTRFPSAPRCVNLNPTCKGLLVDA